MQRILSAFNSALKLPVTGDLINVYTRQTGGFGNVGAVGYYWTRSVISSNWRYRYARDLTFDRYSIHPEFYNSERSAGESIRCIKRSVQS
jgi:hypothetical protein